MTLIDRVRADLLKARKERNKDKSKLLVTLVGEVEGQAKREGAEPSDELVLGLVRKFIKNNNEFVHKMDYFNCEDLLEEIEVLEGYLPKQLTKEELGGIISSLGTKNIGEIMKHMNSTYPDQFDRGLASKIAREL